MSLMARKIDADATVLNNNMSNHFISGVALKRSWNWLNRIPISMHREKWLINDYLFFSVSMTQRPEQRNANDTFSIAIHKYSCEQRKCNLIQTRLTSEWKTTRENIEWMNKSRFYRAAGIRFCAGDIHARHKKRVTCHNKCRMKRATLKYYTTQFEYEVPLIISPQH